MTKVTYAVVQRNSNSYSSRPDGTRQHEFVRDCDHQHRTLSGAQRCLDHLLRPDSLGGVSELGYFGQIEDANGNVIE
jgi:hypothetical protein